jgi:hypothetical protein
MFGMQAASPAARCARAGWPPLACTADARGHLPGAGRGTRRRRAGNFHRCERSRTFGHGAALGALIDAVEARLGMAREALKIVLEP